MANSAQQIEESLNRMQRLGKRLRLLFTILFVSICICMVVVTAMVLAMIIDGTVDDPSHTVSIVVPPAYLIICAVGVMTLRGVSSDMAKGESPFTLAHARRISALGWMLVVIVVAELVVSPGFVAIAIGPLSFINEPYAMFEKLTMPLDMGAVLGAITCFSLSAIWRYGALLQAQTEDLV